MYVNSAQGNALYLAIKDGIRLSTNLDENTLNEASRKAHEKVMFVLAHEFRTGSRIMYPEQLVTELLELEMKRDAIEETLNGGTPIDHTIIEFLELSATRLIEIREILWRNHINAETTGRGEFHTIELFPNDNGLPKSDCTECGAYVKIQQQVLHTHWHNKVADL